MDITATLLIKVRNCGAEEQLKTGARTPGCERAGKMPWGRLPYKNDRGARRKTEKKKQSKRNQNLVWWA